MKKFAIVLVWVGLWILLAAGAYLAHGQVTPPKPLNYHVLVTPLGYSIPGGGPNGTFVSDTANPLQDALNFYLGNAQVYPTAQGFGPYTVIQFTTNVLGATFELSAGVFYKPSGILVSNQFVQSSVRITGAGDYQTFIVGDSNVISMWTNTVADTAPGMWSFELDHCVIAVSNVSSRSLAVDLKGSEITTRIHDNFFGWYGNMVYTNNYQSVGFSQALPKPSGIVYLACNGQTARNFVERNQFYNGAAGVICPYEHVILNDDEFVGFKPSGTTTTNLFMTNDATVFYSGDGASILNSDIAVSPAVILAGQGDIKMTDCKVFSGSVGVYQKGFSSLYGRDIMDNFHFEGTAHDVVIADASDTTTVPCTLEMDNCADQQSVPAQAYNFNTSTHVFSLFGGPAPSAIFTHVVGGAWEPHAGVLNDYTNFDYVMRIDNTPIFVVSAATKSFWITNTLSFMTNGAAP